MSSTKPYVILLPGHRTRTVIRRDKLGDDPSQLIHVTSPKQKTRMVDLPKWLLADGFEVFVAQYQNDGSHTPSIEELADWLAGHITALAKKSPTGSVIIIAHSLGGIITRACIDGPKYKQLFESKKLVDSAFLIGTPNQGTEARWLLHMMIDFTCSAEQKACEQMCNQEYMRKFNQLYTHYNSPTPYYVIGGYRATSRVGKLMSAFFWTHSHQPNDGAMTLTSTTTLPGTYKVGVVAASHEAFMGDQYFQEHHHQPSETYTNYIQPVLLKKDNRNFTSIEELSYPESQPSWWAVLCTPFILSGVVVLFGSRFVFNRVQRAFQQ